MESYDEPTRQAAGQFGGLAPRVLWVIGIAVAVFLVWAGLQVTRYITTSRQIEQVERVVARRPAPAARPELPAAVPPLAAVPASPPPAPAPPAQAAVPAPRAAPAASPAVPPLAAALAGVSPSDAPAATAPPAAYDSSGWSGEDADLAAESSGGGEEASSVPEPRLERRRAAPAERSEAPAVAGESYSSNLFSRCPRPGVPGAVECRRAVCAGAARRAAPCKYYQDGAMD